MYRFQTLIFSVALALAAVLGGCGEGDETANTLTKAEVIQQGDAACQRADEMQDTELTRYIKEHPNAGNSESGQEEILLTIALPPIEEELESLQAFGAPQLAAVVEALETAVEKIEANPSSIAKGAGTPLEEANKLAAKYGFRVCSDFL